jgi:hypothetical protein
MFSDKEALIGMLGIVIDGVKMRGCEEQGEIGEANWNPFVILGIECLRVETRDISLAVSSEGVRAMVGLKCRNHSHDRI